MNENAQNRSGARAGRWLAGVCIGLAVLATPAVFAQSQPAAAATAASAPDEFVKKISTQVLDSIRGDKEIQAGNPRKISEFVDSVIMPHVDFQRMTSLAVGRYWRQATPDQQGKLQKDFRVLLLRTYSGALSSVRDEQIRMKPFRGSAADSETVVRSEVVPKRGDPIQLDYRLAKDGAGWKIYDLNVMGVWLLENYRNQFSQEIGSKGLDGLIQSLEEKNKSFEEAAKKG